MEYKDMLKKDLIKELEKQVHIADAVNAKNIEITELKGEHTKEIEKLNEKHKVNQASAVANKSEVMSRLQENDKKNMEIIQEELEKVINNYNAFKKETAILVDVFKSFLKNLEGGTDNTIILFNSIDRNLHYIDQQGSIKKEVK